MLRKAQAPGQQGSKAKGATPCLRRLCDQHRVGQSLRLS